MKKPYQLPGNAFKVLGIMFDKWKNETDPKKKKEKLNDLFTSPTSMPAKALILGTASGAIFGWVARKHLSKYLTSQKIEEVRRIKAELEKTHTPAQKQLYKQIVDIQKDKDSVKNLMKAFHTVEDLSKAGISGRLVSATMRGLKEQGQHPKVRYMNILIRNYEDTLNNYQMQVYKTLFEAEYVLLNKTRKIHTLTMIGGTLMGFLVGARVGVKHGDKLSKYIKKKERSDYADKTEELLDRLTNPQ